uniref:NADH dehydrogenase subunit 6 n=1 Tax=Megalotomus costalis TaxID=763254 RepID=A0A8K1RPD7_9HEMI|nr:NADH dehydrogenase subunit 6 [Megalotomus costalis]
MIMLMSMMTALSFTLLWLNHPISMGITIISLTITTAMITGLYMGTFWYSYIIMITMLSGMLVLFIYMASVASNEKFKTPISLISSSIIIMLYGIIMYMNYEEFYMENNLNENTLNLEMSLNFLFNTKNKFLTMIMVMYLFFTMATISFIVNITEGPLRINKK